RDNPDLSDELERQILQKLGVLPKDEVEEDETELRVVEGDK
ncbi:DNA recombination/repair protein RecA, partial [Glutamicibacter halophytocola]|nr:DNA recombination/repair protein RecA [Glutamicibacter halophytocola]